MNWLLIVLLIIPAWLLVQVLRKADNERLKWFIEDQGGRIISKKWLPLYSEQIIEEGDTVYELRFIDKRGNQHLSIVNVSGKISFLKDDIIK